MTNKKSFPSLEFSTFTLYIYICNNTTIMTTTKIANNRDFSLLYFSYKLIECEANWNNILTLS